MSKTIWWIVIIVVVLVAGVIIFGGTKSQYASSNNGHVIFAVTDQAAQIKNVSEITMTVSSVELHSQTGGWTTVTSDNSELKLLSLKANGRWEIIANEDIPAGNYDQVRLNISDVRVTTSDGKTVQARIPSGELKLDANVIVAEGQTSTIGIDVLGDLSLHVTGKGEFIFTPVVHTTTRANATATVKSDNSVVFTGGSIKSDINAGMDLNGEVKNNFKVDAKANLNVNAAGGIQIAPGGGNATSSNASGGASGGVNLNVGY